MFMTSLMKFWQNGWAHFAISCFFDILTSHIGWAALADVRFILSSIPRCNDWLAASANSSRPDFVCIRHSPALYQLMERYK